MITPGGGPMKDDRIGPMNPQLAVRVAIVGSLALLMFAVIFLRLWFLQVLTGDQYVAQARTNIVRKVPVAAPRGSVLAADGQVLVDSVKVPAILIQPQQLPVALQPTADGLIHQPAADLAVYDRLARALNMSPRPQKCVFSLTADNGHGQLVTQRFSPQLPQIPCIIAQHAAQITIGNVTIATNIPVAEQAYISERQSEFPGVAVSQVSVSQYPQGQLAAQLLGTVGPLSQSEVHQRQFTGIPSYDSVGQSGLEYQYNQYLQGRDGYQRVEVNAQGTFQGETTPVAPTAGLNVKTSINLAVQKTGQAALARSIAAAPGSDGGAFVAMNPQNGQIYAMGSEPSYDPSVFTKPLTQAQYTAQFGPASGDPLLDRAIQSVGPDGSTFKVITATAALQSGVWSAGETFDDGGQFCPTANDPASCLHNAGHAAYGVLDLAGAIKVSDDVFFYNLGDRLNADPATHPNGGALQDWARRFGIGRRPPIDLPYAASGTLPTPKYVAAIIQAEENCDAAKGPYAYTDGQGGISSRPLPGYHRSPKHAPGGCGIAAMPPEYWTVGDNINTGVGQGDVQMSPLQLARVYAAMANGGRLVTPHIGQDVETPTGTVVQSVPAPSHSLGIDPANLAVIDQGLREAAQSGTSGDVMGSFHEPVYGKTGTAQYFTPAGEVDYAWYACFVPATATSKPIVVVVWVEKGGFGDVSAAPVARQILSQWFFNTPGTYVSGSSTTL